MDEAGILQQVRQDEYDGNSLESQKVINTISTGHYYPAVHVSGNSNNHLGDIHHHYHGLANQGRLIYGFLVSSNHLGRTADTQ